MGSREVVANRRHAVREMSIDGKPAREIAELLQVTERTVVRDRSALKISQPMRRFTDDEIMLAESLLSDGCSFKEVARTLNCKYQSVSKRFPGRSQYKQGGSPELSRITALRRQLGLI